MKPSRPIRLPATGSNAPESESAVSGVRRAVRPPVRRSQPEANSASKQLQERLAEAQAALDHLHSERERLERELASAYRQLDAFRSSVPAAAAPVAPTHHAAEGEREPVATYPEAPAPDAALCEIIVNESTTGHASTATDERRSSERQPCAFEVEFVQESHFFAGLSQDVSTGGVFVATYRSVPVGTHLALSFELPGGVHVAALGEVRWVRESRDGAARPGLGVAFTDLDADTLAAIAGFCRSKPPLYIDLES